jgi:succinate-semialdehyde dehydrogenase/glutarate-semialdehyde dehydrogenase
MTVMTFQSINPANGEPIASYEEWQPHQVQDVIGKVHAAFLAWRHTSFEDRAVPMRKAAQVLRENATRYGRLMAEEMGKPLRDGIAEAQKCALACDFYADNAARFLAREPVATEAPPHFVTFNPIGVVLAPWNFPFWQVFRFAAPGLMAGKPAVLKHASNVPGCALAIEAVFREAGFPDHLFRTVLIGSRQVEAAIENPLVRAVTLTGSGPPGARSPARPGRCSRRPCWSSGAATRTSYSRTPTSISPPPSAPRDGW